MWFGLSSTDKQKTSTFLCACRQKKGFVLASPFCLLPSFVCNICAGLNLPSRTFYMWLDKCTSSHSLHWGREASDCLFLHFLIFIFQCDRFRRSSPLSSAHTYDSPFCSTIVAFSVNVPFLLLFRLLIVLSLRTYFS